MVQNILIKTEVASPASNAVGVNSTSSDSSDVQPFATEFNKQLDKQEQPQQRQQTADEPPEQSAQPVAESVDSDDKQVKAEKVDNDDGKKVPQQNVTATENSELEIAVDSVVPELVVETAVAEVISEDIELETEAVKTEGEVRYTTDSTKVIAENADEKESSDNKPVKPAATTAVSTNESREVAVKQVIVSAKQQHEVIAPTSAAASTAKLKQDTKLPTQTSNSSSSVSPKTSDSSANDVKVVPTSVAPSNSTEGLSSDQKKNASSLRPDILYGINKKYSAKNSNSGDVLPIEEVKTSERLINKASSEGQLAAELAKQVKAGQPVSSPPTAAITSLVAMQALATNSAQPAASSTTPVLDIQPGLQTAAWNRVMSGRVVWMAREGVQQAELKLNPANLGPVEVKLSMTNEQASITFVASNAATRDALEQALPRLRDSFVENGMELKDAEVTQHSSEQEQQSDSADDSGANVGQAASDGEELSDEQQLGLSEEELLEQGLSLYA
ncbi:hypothetical protein A9Q78_10180 [Methylophaga sp. 41_12_T18]|nr:hypothetical protein A9Q78_10180 [Methylophaga sp. 41_12_T18]